MDGRWISLSDEIIRMPVHQELFVRPVLYPTMDKERTARLIEFFSIGIVMGVTEDLIVVVAATNEEITLQMIGIIVLVAIPFAGLSELVVDQEGFAYFERIAVWLATALANHK